MSDDVTFEVHVEQRPMALKAARNDDTIMVVM